MPKSFNKNKNDGRKRHATAASSSSSIASSVSSGSSVMSSVPSIGRSPARKRKKSNTGGGIAKSKQLVEKLRRTRSTRSFTNKNNEPRLCGNGKPMPSLADLERMFEDSDDDGEQSPPVATTSTNATSRCKTPEQPLVITKEKLISPKTINKIATKMMDIIEKIPPIVIDDTYHPPPVIPQKKRKKPDVPYIVGCKERSQVPWAPKTNVFKGDEDYGVDANGNLSEDEQNSCPKKRRRTTTTLNISKSIFNAKSDEIALRLLEAENEEVSRNDSPDSNETIGQSSPLMSRSFSPLPSTSTDNETFLINTQRFKESLQADCLGDDDSLNVVEIPPQPNKTENDVEIIEISYETIALDDTVQDRSAIKTDHVNSYTEDDCCIVEPQRDIKRRATTSPITIDSQDDIYSSVDLTQGYDNYACEIIDVDDVIAENNAIIEKYRNESDLDAVILVEPSTSCSPKQSGPKNTTVAVNIPNSSQSDTQNDIEVAPPLGVNNAQILNEQSTNDDIQVIDSVITSTPTPPNRIANLYSHATHNTNTDNVPDWVAVLSAFQQTLMEEIVESNIRNSRLDSIEQQISDLQAGNITVTNITRVPANNNNLPINQRLIQNHAQVNQADNSTLTEKVQENETTPRLGDCPICMDNLSANSIASTLCGHVFCLNCIRAAIRTNGKKCPTCRKSLRGVGYHQLYL